MANFEGDAIVVDDRRVVRGGREVLPGRSGRVPVGEVVGLLGPSGGGKSTLMRAVVGVQVVEGGTVTVLGEPAGSPALRHRVGYLTQAPSVYADLSVRDNVRYFASVLGVDDDAVDQAIESVDLTDHATARVENLSGGQLSRASLPKGLPVLLVVIPLTSFWFVIIHKDIPVFP